MAAVFSADRLIKLMKDVIEEEDNRRILQIDLRYQEALLLNITAHFESQQEAVPETLKIWLQLLHNSLTQAITIFHRSPTSSLHCFMCNQARLSKEIKEWKLLFNYLFEGLLRDFLISKFVSDVQFFIAPVIQRMKYVVEEEKERHILQSCDLRHMEALLLHITTYFESQQEAVQVTHKIWLIWLPLVHNSLTQAIYIFHRSPTSSLHCFMCNQVRLSKEIKEWKLRFNYLFEGLLRDFFKFLSDEQFFIPPTDPVIQLMKDVIEEEDNCHILQTDLKPINNLLLDVTPVLHDQQKLAPGILKIWLQLLHNCLAEAKTILRRRYDPGRLSEHVKEWRVNLDYLFHGFQRDFTVFVQDNGFNIVSKDLTPVVEALSKDEAWMLFSSIAFKSSRVSEDIEEHAKNIAEECRGLPLPITLVAAAMMGKNSVDEWKSCLSSIKINEDPSFPDIHPPLVDKHLYQQLRWCYDALLNSNVQNCFLYCAMYERGDYIYVEELVETWIAEGLVKNKEGSHLMDMAIGRTYINLLIHRCFFQNATDPDYRNDPFYSSPLQRIRVADVIRDVAIFIGETEEKCVFKAGQELHNFPETENEECKRISVRRNNIENLPTEFRRPKLVSLFLSHNPIKEVPSGFLVGLTSLKVLHLSGQITSIPSSIGQLKQLQFLNLSDLPIEDLPKEMGQLSSLQFLNISYCESLQSLPSEIGGLTNLKSLNLIGCGLLEVIPHEIFQLTSLNKLDIDMMRLGMMSHPSEVTIWKMKDLRNLKMLRIWNISSRIKVGIMGNWLEMRHLCLHFKEGYSDELPHDMQKMSKLQSFILSRYEGFNLPDHTFKFQHLQYIQLALCPRLKELSPLERLPNLKYLELNSCDDLKELGIGESDRASRFLMLETLVLDKLPNLESIAGACNNGVWNERTLPRLRTVVIYRCPFLKRLPVGMEKLQNLRTIIGEQEWWQTLIWEDESMRIHFQNLFTDWNTWLIFQC